MIGKRVLYGYGQGEKRVEDNGEVMDKVRMTDIVRNDKGETIGFSQHDIYLIKKKDGNFTTIHPINLIREL